MYEQLYDELLGMTRDTMSAVLHKNAREVHGHSKPVVSLTPELLRILENRYGTLPDDLEYQTVFVPAVLMRQSG